MLDHVIESRFQHVRLPIKRVRAISAIALIILQILRVVLHESCQYTLNLGSYQGSTYHSNRVIGHSERTVSGLAEERRAEKAERKG